MMFATSTVARLAPSVALKSFAGELNESDRRIIEEYEQEYGSKTIMEFFVEAFRQGTGGVVLEYRLWAEPWGFSFDEAPVLVHLWHGEDDLMVPLHHAEDLASRLPRSRLHVLPGEGHVSIQGHFGAMLDALAAARAF